MATSKLFSSFFLVIFSLVFVGFAQQTPGSPGTSLPCVQKLLPCEPYLKQPTNPPPTCCIVLKQVVADDKQCLCVVFNNPVILKGLNITQDDALKLANACKADADPSICKTVAGPPSATPTPPTSNSPPTTNSTSSPPKSAAVGVGAPFGVSMAISFLLVLMLSKRA